MSNEQAGTAPIQIQATPARPTDSSWIDYQQKEKQESIKRLEETAKYLSGLSSLSLSIIVAVNGEALRQTMRSAPRYLEIGSSLKNGVVCWLLSILLTLAVVFPFRYKYVENSADSIRQMNNKIGQVKFWLLVLGALLYIIGISRVTYLYLFIS
ncbi:hypothetical protein D3H65_29690 [Paraflavitalea soli]|uniref:Uncharacterized protein n=1 Tax=Paraflavitalea soli TaxID=2315862 RepID=A0A3B7MXV3_9BACT|nr:hypothetical protein [Paraflavitalea soli]AXY77910.1 hypothetical protein D3H65_29690 [Paraflavitalea soli]